MAPLVCHLALVVAGPLTAPAALASAAEPAAGLAAALPAVVRIDVVKREQSAPAKSAFMEQLDRLLERPDQGDADPRRESGSGFVLDAAAGLVAAAEFVVRDAESITVQQPDGRKITAELVAADEETQLALLRVPMAGLPAAEWADSRTLRRGDAVYAAGLEPGDVILSFAGQDIAGAYALRRLVADTAPGSVVEVTYSRRGSRRVAKVTLDQR